MEKKSVFKIDNRYFDLLIYRSFAELKSEAARAYLGVLWWLIEPLLYLSVFYVVFGLILKRGGEGYVSFLLCGLVVWKWFESTVKTASGTIAHSVGLMGQVYFPKIILPGIVIVTNTFKFLIILAVFIVFLVFCGTKPTVAWLGLPILIIVEYLFISASACLVAAIVTFIPDMKHLVNYAITLMFFMSGIFFGLDTIPENIRCYFLFNPMVVIIDGYRMVLLKGISPDWITVGYVAMASLFFLGTVILLFKKYDRIFPRVV